VMRRARCQGSSKRQLCHCVVVASQLICGLVAATMNEKALYYVEMLLKAAEVVNRRSSGTCCNYCKRLADARLLLSLLFYR